MVVMHGIEVLRTLDNHMVLLSFKTGRKSVRSFQRKIATDDRQRNSYISVFFLLFKRNNSEVVTELHDR